MISLEHNSRRYTNWDPQALLAEGVPQGVIDAAVLAQTRAVYTAAIERHVDDVARSWDYSSAVSISSYTNSTNPAWAAEAQAFIAWRDQVWTQALDALAQAEQSGAIPTLADLIASLPQIVRPEA